MFMWEREEHFDIATKKGWLKCMSTCASDNWAATALQLLTFPMLILISQDGFLNVTRSPQVKLGHRDIMLDVKGNQLDSSQVIKEKNVTSIVTSKPVPTN